MSWQRGWGEATPGTDARPVNRGRMVTLSRGEIDDMVEAIEARHQRAVKWVGVLAVALGMLCGAGVSRAFGHGWYDQACCSDKDCAPIPESAVTWTERGWRVELRPGQHPMVKTHSTLQVVPFDEVLPSQDDRWHACVVSEAPDEASIEALERIICLYIPEGRFGS